MEKNRRQQNVPIRKSNTTESRSLARKEAAAAEVLDGADGQTQLETRFLGAQTNLSSSRRRLLSQILNEADETFFLSSRDLGRRYSVDSATIVRTVQAIGYKKFADFAHDLRNHFVTQITPYTAMKAAAQTHRSLADYVRLSVDNDLDNLNSLKAGLNVQQIVDLAKQVHRSRRIVVIGIDFAASLAMSLAYGLVRLGCDAEAPTGSTGVVQSKVRIMTEKDLLVAISFGQGLRETIEAARRARQQHVPTFGITDSDKTPIARYCEQYLVASIARTSFLDSYVAPVAAINAILVACAHSQTKRALELLAQTDKEDGDGSRWFRESNALAKRSGTR
jgi:DNA-binding MurR/RpiR family transcriptional regulator